MDVTKGDAYRPATAAALMGFGAGTILVSFGGLFVLLAGAKFLHDSFGSASDLWKADLSVGLIGLVLVATGGVGALLMLAGRSFFPGRRTLLRPAALGLALASAFSGVALIVIYMVVSSRTDNDLLTVGILLLLGGALAGAGIWSYRGLPAQRTRGAILGGAGALLVMVANVVSASSTSISVNVAGSVGEAVLKGLATLLLAAAAVIAIHAPQRYARAYGFVLGAAGLLAAVGVLVSGVQALRGDPLNPSPTFDHTLGLLGGVPTFLGAVILILASVVGMFAAILAVIAATLGLAGTAQAQATSEQARPKTRLMP